MWWWVLGACAIAFATKGAGFLIPAHRLESPRITRVAGVMTIGLLAALITMNTFADGQRLRLDARIVALAVAMIAFALRAPYLLVVVLGAAAAAGVRLLGWG
ncbi:branched-chain amino acid transporter AzlD [Enemella dayhoffiae]|uniref:Branched-chain amino acid transporter AzlD n=2 Tax=Enemella dayhoffiae TaxID=2016507 RepID=A0A255GUR0_9ACTN|nr:branched-chain amino acid transporter AzlD [Enemella dayhoffiae]